MTTRAGRRWLTSLTALAAVILVVGAGLTATRAVAVMEEVTETGARGMLALRAGPAAPHWEGMRPGDAVYWPIEASLTDAAAGSLSLELRADGDLVTVAMLTASVVTCTAPFVHVPSPKGTVAQCHAASTTVLAETRLADLGASAGRFALADLEQGDPRHLLVTLRLPASVDPAAVEGAAATIGVGLHAAGDAPLAVAPPRSPERLPVTGMDVSAIGVLGIGLLGLGACLVARRRLPAGS